MVLPPLSPHLLGTRLAAATSTPRLHALALPDLHRRFVVYCRCAHPLLYLSRHGEESLFDVGGVFG